MKTPVVFIIYNNPRTTARVFERIRCARPSRLLVIAGGPRENAQDRRLCSLTRDIIDRVDWDCEVLKCYHDKNLGCYESVSQGLTWAFEQLDEAIFLEHDTLPHPSFFPFCEQLLEKYRHNEKVSFITGQNVQFGKERGEGSYYFSKYFFCWGWAGWKRAWSSIDFKMTRWPQLKCSGWLEGIFSDPEAARYWRTIFEQTYQGDINTFDYQILFSHLIAGGLTVVPNRNLVSNIGFSNDCPHNQDERSPFASMVARKMAFPLSHPEQIAPHQEADDYAQATLFNPDFHYNHRQSYVRMLYRALRSRLF